MIRAPAGRLPNLLSTAEAVRENRGIRYRGPNGWQQHSLVNFERELAMLLAETKGSSSD
jgi:hypothetical protein